MKRHILNAIIVVIVLAVVFIFSLDSIGSENIFHSQPTAKKGILDLSEFSFSDSMPPHLDGEWEFYPQTFISHFSFYLMPPQNPHYAVVPNVWNNYPLKTKTMTGSGYATYRIHVKLPPEEKEMAMIIPTISSSYQIFVDGTLVAECGKPGINKQASISKYNTQLVIFNTYSDEIEIILHISNYFHARGGLWSSIILGEEAQLIRWWQISLARDLFLFGSFIILGIFLTIGHFVLRKDKSMLFLSGTCFAISVRILFTGNTFITILFPSIDAATFTYCDYLTLFWVPALMTLFFLELFPEETYLYTRHMILASAIIFTLVASFFPASFYTGLRNIYLIVIFIYLSNSALVTFRAYWNKNPFSLIILYSMLFLLLACLHDILYNMNFLHAVTFEMVPIILLGVILTHTYMLFRTTANMFLKIQALSISLQASLEEVKIQEKDKFRLMEENRFNEVQLYENRLYLEKEMERRLLAEALRDSLRDMVSTTDIEDIVHKLMAYMTQAIGFLDSITFIKTNAHLYSAIYATGKYTEMIPWELTLSPEQEYFYCRNHNIPLSNLKILFTDDPAHPLPVSNEHELLLMPLTTRDALTGIILIENCPECNQENDTPEIIEAFLQQAAVAIDNAALFSDVRKLATTDYLTGMHNRMHFIRLAEAQFADCVAKSRPLCLIILDIDHFKKVNDNHGHAAGDDVLEQMSNILKTSMRDQDICGRYGGEEFLILLPEKNEDLALAIAERLRRTIEKNLFFIGTADDFLNITASFGIASYGRTQAKNLDELIQQADEALYFAKKSGRNQTIIYGKEKNTYWMP